MRWWGFFFFFKGKEWEGGCLLSIAGVWVSVDRCGGGRGMCEEEGWIVME